MKYLKKVNEFHSEKIENFIEMFNSIINDDEDYSQGEEPSEADILSNIGDLCNELDMSSEDIQYVIDNCNINDRGINYLNIIKKDTENLNNESDVIDDLIFEIGGYLRSSVNSSIDSQKSLYNLINKKFTISKKTN